jgi:hypothetical protein
MSNQPNLPPYPSAFPAPQTSTLAIISLVAGIATWLIVPILGAIVAIITGNMARRDIAASNGTLTGNGLAVTGLVLGYAQIFLLVIPLFMICLLALLGPAIGNVFSNIVADI